MLRFKLDGARPLAWRAKAQALIARLAKIQVCLFILFGYFLLAPLFVFSAPQIFAEKPSFDFGKVENRSPIQHTYTLTNRGDDPLEIKQVKPGCGCTVAHLSTNVIAPRTSTELKVSLDLAGKRGMQNKYINVFSNDPLQPKLRLELKGVALPDVEVTPKRLFFGVIEPGQRHERKVKISTYLDNQLQVESVRSSNPIFEVEMVEEKPGQSYALLVRAGPDLESGLLSGEILVATDHERHAEISISVSAQVPDLLTVSPLELRLSQQQLTPVIRYIIVRPGLLKEFEILDVEMPDPALEWSLDKLPQKGVRIRVANLDAKLEIHGENIVIRTNLEEKPEIQIPIQIIDTSREE